GAFASRSITWCSRTRGRPTHGPRRPRTDRGWPPRSGGRERLVARAVVWPRHGQHGTRSPAPPGYIPCMHTASDAFLDALTAAGVSYLFANFGSDHPAVIEALARAAATGRPVPKVITCPFEMVALSAAHGAAQVTGRAE